MSDTADRIFQYEAGELEESEIVELFQELVNTGTAWHLQGHYGRTAHALIGAGLVTRPAMCQWFALCDRQATGTTPHPILGDVPTCDRCKERATS